MRIFTTLLLVLMLLAGVSVANAQQNTKSKSDKSSKLKSSTSTSKDSKKTANTKPAVTKKDTKAKAKDSKKSTAEKKSNTAASDTTKQIKDAQNQTQFMKPDMASKNFNFYRRREISTPLQPRYDLDSAVYQQGKKKQKQQQAYISNQYYFPAKPRDAWELGINFGSAFVSGDVKPYYMGKGIIQNVGFGFTIRKALSYMFSLRLGYNYFCTTGRNWEPDANLKFNSALHGYYDKRVNYWDNPNLVASKTKDTLNMNKFFFYNYRTYMHEAHLAVVMNFGNASFHKERNYVNAYVLAGVSAMMFTTYTDALNANGDVYDFSEAAALYYKPQASGVNSRIKSDRKEALKILDNLYDGKYESFAEKENNTLGIKNWQFVPSFTAGLGLQFHLSKWVTLGLEERVLITGSDLLDGYRWQQDEHPGMTRDNDNLSYTSININIHLGGKKSTEPMFWLNPNVHTYKKLGDMNPKAIADDILKDDDGDGVINALDKEPATKKGCPVDTHGVALDSDHDGIIDCDDKEPYSPPGFPIDSNGVAIIPPNPCCDTAGIGEGIPGGPNGLGGNKGRKGNSGYDCAKIELPSTIFDDDKYYLDPQYYGNLHQIAERMQMCPDMKLVVTGYDESRNDQKYNEQLAWNRANAAVDYLVEKYGISRDRFIVKYQGGKKAATGSAFEKKMKNKVEFRYANDGEGGDSNPPAPHPGLKAGSNK
ncbi:MAG: OmpA family protein [Bacteroidetes bacterium]|nr:OmpA family protein [Bacteroidota bacterium]